jgi:hypothetical protein
MGLGVIVGSEKDMYLGWTLVEVSGIDVEDLMPQQWWHIARGRKWHAKGERDDSERWRGTIVIDFEKNSQR